MEASCHSSALGAGGAIIVAGVFSGTGGGGASGTGACFFTLGGAGLAGRVGFTGAGVNSTRKDSGTTGGGVWLFPSTSSPACTPSESARARSNLNRTGDMSMAGRGVERRHLGMPGRGKSLVAFKPPVPPFGLSQAAAPTDAPVVTKGTRRPNMRP